MTENIKRHTAERITTMTIARPEKRNAITQNMYTAMAVALEDYAKTDDIRVFVITGAEEYFTSGNDLQDFMLGSDEGDVPPVIRFLNALAACPKPVIAAVNGPAIGIGVTMLLHSDLVFISETATFSTPFVQLALVPEAASSMLLPATVGMAMANDMLLANRVLNASEAVASGLASRVLPFDALMSEVDAVAHRLANAAPEAVTKTKSLIRNQQHEIAAHMALETAMFTEQLRSAEFSEMVEAKMQKREPRFR